MPAPSILLVDDEKFFLDLERDFLKDSPVTILTAASGAEAIEMVREHAPNLIFMDLRMPEMDGSTCCDILKDNSVLRTVPIILVITSGREKDQEALLNAHCDGVITKPLDRKEFLCLAHKFLPHVERRLARVTCGPSLAVFRRNSESFHGTIEDISNCGVYVASRCIVSMEERINIGFILPGTELIEAEGRVAWVNSGLRRTKQRLPEGFGLEFTTINPDDSAIIRRFVEKHTAA